MAARYGTGLIPEGVVAETSRCACGSADATSATVPAGTVGIPAGAVDRKVKYLTRFPCERGSAGFALALMLAGYRNVQIYDGSWEEWGDREDLPIETGDPRGS